MRQPNFYADVGLDRAGLRRKDAAWVAGLIADPATRFVPIRKGAHIVAETDETPRAVLLGRRDVAPALDRLFEEEPPVLLGLDSAGTAYFALDLPAEIELADVAALDPATHHFRDLRAVGPRLEPRSAALLSYARGMLNWHARHRFCGVCGHATRSDEAGHVRLCTNAACATSHFPRTDPVVIMLVTDGDRCLLGRQKTWPPGMYSALAGFVEPGESLEEAVAREVFEEAGVRAVDIRYNSSQPWAFPGSLMIGFEARAATTEIHIDTELEDARWFARDWIKAGGGNGFWMPPRSAIARRLIDDWLAV